MPDGFRQVVRGLRKRVGRERGYQRLGRHIGVDTRALATFRMLLGGILILDLLLRARNLRLLYTDEGLYPVSVLADQYPIAVRFSVHALSGALWYQAALFALASCCALALLVGYRTRLATLVCLYLLAALHIRNPHVLSGADALLEHLLFWSLFLPLGERWSVDARRVEKSRTRIVSVASAALLVQVLLVYGVNAVLKFGSKSWLSGTAVETVFRIDRYIVLLGSILAEFPVALEAANWVWLGLLLASPLLVVFTGRLRAVLAGSFAVVHLGMFLTMQLGIFPLVSIIALTPFFPRGVWDTVDTATETVRGRLYAGKFLATLAARLPELDTPVESRIPSQWVTRGAQTIVALVLVSLVVFNAIAVGVLPAPPQAETVSEQSLESRWTLFAPNPPDTERFFTVSGQFDSGETVDVLGVSPLRWRTPDRTEYSTARMRKFVSHLVGDAQLQAALSAYLCSWWDRTHESSLVSVSMTLIVRSPAGQGGEQSTRFDLSTFVCGSESGERTRGHVR